MTPKNFSYPYITSEQNVLSGTPIIEGTRIPVRCIAGYYQIGMSVDDILISLSHLTPAQVHSALAYYFDIVGVSPCAYPCSRAITGDCPYKISKNLRTGTYDMILTCNFQDKINLIQ